MLEIFIQEDEKQIPAWWRLLEKLWSLFLFVSNCSFLGMESGWCGVPNCGLGLSGFFMAFGSFLMNPAVVSFREIWLFWHKKECICGILSQVVMWEWIWTITTSITAEGFLVRWAQTMNSLKSAINSEVARSYSHYFHELVLAAEWEMFWFSQNSLLASSKALKVSVAHLEKGQQRFSPRGNCCQSSWINVWEMPEVPKIKDAFNSSAFPGKIIIPCSWCNRSLRYCSHLLLNADNSWDSWEMEGVIDDQFFWS